MIKIIIELWPYGFENHKRHLGTVNIKNDGTGNTNTGNYNIEFVDKKDRIFKRKRVENHPRKSKSIWNLLYKAFKEYYS